MPMKKIMILLTGLLLLVTAYAGGPVNTGMAIDFSTFFSVNRLGSPLVSASGKFMIFTVKKALLAENKYETQIWRIEADGSGLRQLTSSIASSNDPQIGLNDVYLYFLAKRGTTSQVWKLPLSGGEAQPVTDLYGDISGFAMSADNKNLLLQRMVDPDCTGEESIQKSSEQKQQSKSRARIIDHLMYRHWNEWLEGKFGHLFLYDLEKSQAEDITPGAYHTPPIALGSSSDYCFSADGQEICFVSNHDAQLATSTNNDIFLFNLATKKTTRISSSPGNDCNPHYSPDGVYIAYTSMERAGFEADRQRLMLYGRKTGKTAELTTGFTLSVDEIIWSADSRDIYFTSEEAENTSLYKVNLKTKKIEAVLKGHYVSGVKFLNKDEMVFSGQSTRYPAEIFKYNLRDRKLTQLTHFNTEDLDRFDLPGYEEFWFSGALGDSVQGFIMKPPGFVQGRRYPAVHLIHGGPQGAWNNNFHFRWNYQMFAAPGYVVYWINFHGSRGYGQKFTDIISGHWGDYPYEDLVKGTEYVLSHYDYVDGDRLAAAGASYGGFMVNWIAGHEHPYKCLISHDGIYEQISMYGATEELWFPEWEFGGLPWQENTTYQQWSPGRLAGNFKTPMLIVHGENDYRVPYTQGLQMFTALQRQGVASRLLYFPDEDHFVQKPQNAQVWWDTVYEWLGKYLK
jgi:dipeptidyl aminopeptidase/acylaminoacyl peptidase